MVISDDISQPIVQRTQESFAEASLRLKLLCDLIKAHRGCKICNHTPDTLPVGWVVAISLKIMPIMASTANMLPCR